MLGLLVMMAPSKPFLSPVASPVRGMEQVYLLEQVLQEKKLKHTQPTQPGTSFVFTIMVNSKINVLWFEVGA